MENADFEKTTGGNNCPVIINDDAMTILSNHGFNFCANHQRFQNVEVKDNEWIWNMSHDSFLPRNSKEMLMSAIGFLRSNQDNKLRPKIRGLLTYRQFLEYPDYHQYIE